MVLPKEFFVLEPVGIETGPIDHNGLSTGFQAKFYDTKLSVNKNDIIESLKKQSENMPLSTPGSCCTVNLIASEHGCMPSRLEIRKALSHGT